MPQVSEHIERLVQLVKGEEGPETVDGSSVASAEEQKDGSDDEDHIIEEV